MKMDLKSKKGKLILFGSLATVAVVATAIAVPVALLVPKNDAPLTPLEKEVAAFNKLYSNALSISTSTGGVTSVTVNREAFLNRTDLPADFQLPSVVTAVAANAFKGAKLSLGFTIPAGVTIIDPTAFAEAVFDEDDYWINSKAEAGASVVTLENNSEWKAFVALYPNTLSGKTLVDDAFKGRLDLPADFALPSFLTKIGARAFSNSKFPAGFQLPIGVTSVGENAMSGLTLPDGFVIPKKAALGDNAFANTVFPKNFALPDEMIVVGFEGNTVSGKAIRPFSGATFAEGFTLKNTVTAVSSGAFYNAKLPLDFMIPTATKLYSVATDGTWVSDSTVKLSDVLLPDDAKWSDEAGAVPGAIVVAYPPADQVADFNRKYNNALTVSGSTITVKEGAFLNRADLPAGFTLPSSVTAIAANAFKSAKLPLGFKIPQGVTRIDTTAFADVVFDENLYWDNSRVEAGAKIDTLDNNTEWKAFNTLYPNKIQGKTLVALAFKENKSLPAGFSLPSFVTTLEEQVFSQASLPSGFTLPNAVTSIGDSAFLGVTLPSGFMIPPYAYLGLSPFAGATFPAGFRLPDTMVEIGFTRAGQNSAFQTICFGSAIFPQGFTIGPNVRKIAEGAFTKAQLPLGFEIPSTAKILAVSQDYTWNDNSANALRSPVLPDGSKWDKGSAVSGAKIVCKTTTTNP